MTRLSPLALAVALAAAVVAPAAQPVPLGRPDSLKFAVIGDNGTGGREQYDVGRLMAEHRQKFPFEFVLMTGDNLYGSQGPNDFVMKFERPYRTLLDAGVKFYPALGNHDDPNAALRYPPFNMNGARYYTFGRRNVRFVVADTNYLDAVQMTWLENTLRDAREEWKFVNFHHPLYSNGTRHGSSIELRLRIEPLLVRYGVAVVVSGHDHIYERFKPQKGITYFVIGSGGQLRKGGIHPSNLTALGFADDQTFTLMEVAGSELYFQTIARSGRIVDAGTIESGQAN